MHAITKVWIAAPNVAGYEAMDRNQMIGDLKLTEFLFSYGTLQLETVQMATFGRQLTGTRDVLVGFEETLLVIEDPAVILISGKAHHTIAKFTGRDADTILGTVYAVTAEEIQSADKYEVAPCQRVEVILQSGIHAWVYVDGRHQPS